MARPLVATYSIAGCDLEARQWGVAVQSKFLAVGSVVPWAEPGVGAVATQAYAKPRFGPDGLSLLRQGLAADEVVERLVAADEGRDERQLGVVDAKGRGASWTGPECLEWAGHRNGSCYAAQGNILVGAATVDALAERIASEVRRGLVDATEPGGRTRGVPLGDGTDVLAAVVFAFVEEVVFRGVVLQTLLRDQPPARAIAAGS